MKDYCFTIANLRILLRTPSEISISDNLQPFLCRCHTEPDCTIELQPCTTLPTLSENGVWYGPEYHDCPKGNLRIFHHNDINAPPFALTEFQNGNIKICVLPAYLSYFAGTAGIFNRIGLETLLLQHHSLLLHASLIKYNGKAIAFAGPSGIGKSTQADIWHDHLGADILNGDRAVLRKTYAGWFGYGSPAAGTSGIYKNDGAPLSGIVLLQQDDTNRIRQLSTAEALSYIYPEISVHHWQKDFVSKATDLCLELLAETPVYLLACRPEKSAALLVKEGLKL